MLRYLIFIILLLFYFTSLQAQNCRGTGAIPANSISQPLRSRITGGCNPVTSPNPYIESTCIASIQRYLARAVNMEDLLLLNVSGGCFGVTNSPVDTLNCQSPYNVCAS